jgi:hypothetical protein
VFQIEAPPVAGYVGPVHIHDLQILGDGTGGSGIYFDPQMANRLLAHIRVQRVRIEAVGGDGIRLHGFNGGNAAVVGDHFSDLEVSSCGGVGMSVKDATFLHVARSRFTDNGRAGFRATSTEDQTNSEVGLHSCVFRMNRRLEPTASSREAEVVVSNCRVVTVESCRFHLRRFTDPDPVTHGVLELTARGLVLDGCGGSAVLRSSSFEAELDERQSVVSGSTGVDVAGVPLLAANGSHCILTNRFVHVATGVAFASNTRSVLVHPQYAVDGPATEVVGLPMGPEDAPLGSPTRRSAGGAGIVGPLVPRTAVWPTSNVKPGMLAYVDGDLWVCRESAGSQAVWVKVALGEVEG